MIRRVAGFPVAVAMAIAGNAADAQVAGSAAVVPLPGPGSEVRVWQRGPAGEMVWKTVTVERWTPDTVSGTYLRTGTAVTLRPDTVPRIDLMVGRESRRRNAVIGASVGFVLGTAVGYVFFSHLPYPCGSPGCKGSRRTELVAGAIYGGAPIGVLGALIGSSIPGRKQWMQVHPTPSR